MYNWIFQIFCPQPKLLNTISEYFLVYYINWFYIQIWLRLIYSNSCVRVVVPNKGNLLSCLLAPSIMLPQYCLSYSSTNISLICLTQRVSVTNNNKYGFSHPSYLASFSLNLSRNKTKEILHHYYCYFGW